MILAPIKTEYFLFGLSMTLILILIFFSFVCFKVVCLYKFLISFSTLEANPGNKVDAPDKIIFL